MKSQKMNQFIRSVKLNRDKVENFDEYPFSLPIIKNLDKIEFHPSVTFIVGENGCGKSTILESIAVSYGFNPEGGTRNYSFSTYDSHSEMHEAIRLSRSAKARWGYFLRADSFYNVATKEEEYSKGPCGQPMELHKKSHGESFLAMVQNTFEGQGLYFLDEPEAALSPQRQLTLLLEIDRCRKDGAQFFIATHSPILLGLPDAEILTFDDGQIHPCEYEETESFRITELFIRDREHLLEKLLKD